VTEINRDQLLAEFPVLLENMSSPRLVLLHRVMVAMTRGIEQTVEVPDKFFSPEFVEAIGDQLVLHHGANEKAVKGNTFEHVFRNAAQAVGHTASIVENPNAASADVYVDDMRFSLKTETAKRQSKIGVYIQKLMEARWIRDYETPAELAAAAAELIPEHLEQYDRIVLLRGKESSDSVNYTLVEIPKDILMLVANLVGNDFPPKNGYGGTSADVFKNGVRVFRLRLDGSVEKVRLFLIRFDHCIVRARWSVPLDVGEPDGSTL
jgi:hypothetical protein